MKFTIPIVPTPKRTGKIVRHGKYAGIAPTDKQKKYVADLLAMLAYNPNRPKEPLLGPLSLSIWAFLPIPRSKPDWWKDAARRGVVYPTPKPDMSNLTKQIEDCMTIAGYIGDDSQIVDTKPGGKRYSDNPRWEIEIIEMWQPASAKEYYQYLEEREDV